MRSETENLPFGLKKNTIERIKSVFSGHPQIDQVIIYRSRAKGNYRNGSDIDLTIKGEAVTLSELMKIETELDDLLLPYKIDLSLLHKINDAEVIDHIKRVGVVFYEKLP
jgi:predicted nucleotidyltransferase